MAREDRVCPFSGTYPQRFWHYLLGGKGTYKSYYLFNIRLFKILNRGLLMFKNYGTFSYPLRMQLKFADTLLDHHSHSLV